MATSKSVTSKVRAKSAAVPYVDEKRDHRDLVVITAIRTAFEIVREDDNDAGGTYPLSPKIPMC
jgi:hypothetical protein